MNIKFDPKSNRRIAYTDRKSGYFEFQKDCTGNGYLRSKKRFFTEITVNGHSLGEAKEICVLPQGFSANFDSVRADISLLIDEQAFYIWTPKNAALRGILPAQILDDGPHADGEISDLQNWNSTVIDGVCVISNQTGIAVGANFNFYSKINEETLELHSNSSEDVEFEQELFSNDGWYVVFEENEQLAVEKAVRLAKEKAINAHIEKVKSFIEKVKIDSGDARFDQAYTWARFSGWLLATKDHGSDYRGIWAGLPWFRDNWGRDTFISINGTLLASGCFDEAKDVLLGFAGFQDKSKESSSYGRIPNRYRDAKDVIYNTADGTLWFIRSVWEYVQYSGDFSIFEQLRETIELALDADIYRCDSYGFLKHGDADTWMDARIMGEEPLSPRGDRANDIQALWFTALRVGAKIMDYLGKKEKAECYSGMAEKVKKNFISLFWDKDRNALADHLPEGGLGDWIKDWRVRPNQLFAITVPSILPRDEENLLVPAQIAQEILKNVNRELVTPFGLFSLSSEDPLFHPEHENPDWYNKDAAYHNGTIWEWNTGAYISAACESSNSMTNYASGILLNESKMILDYGCAGSLSENIHARQDEFGNPKLSGTFSQAWSVAEYVRNVSQDLVGFIPRIAEGALEVNPHFPVGLKELNVEIPFGGNWTIKLHIERKMKEYKICAEWICDSGEKFAEASRIPLKLNGTAISPNKPLTISVETSRNVSVFEKFTVPEKWINGGFPEHDLNSPWCGSEKKKDYLFDLIKSGRMKASNGAGENTGALEWYFDSEDFEKEFTTTLELGAIYSKKKTVFRLWAPTSRAVKVILFEKGNDCDSYKEIEMKPRNETSSKGVWEVEVKGDLHGVYYKFKNLCFGVENIFADPYAKACGVNGMRSMVVDLTRTNPDGWDNFKIPVISSPSNAVVYEAHVADITSSPDWNGPENLRRTFAGAAYSGTALGGHPTGFDYIKSLGITHMQVLPMFDYRSVDEAEAGKKEVQERPTFGAFNWGYDPWNYCCPEGSYSTNPFDGEVRIKECKQMVMEYAKAGIGIVMDVVYNHVNDGIHHGLGASVPGYFYRLEAYSGAGEDTACERSMFRRYLVDTMAYWLKEYKLCGFRFDLMGLHDAVAINEVKERLTKIKHDVLIYGEGWDMYHAGKMYGASQVNCDKLNEIGFFNDAVRCAIKGPIFDDCSKGFIHNGNRREAVKFGIVGATSHPQVDNEKVEGTANPKPWGTKSWLSVNYTEIHDNITLNDKELLTEPGKSDEYYAQMQKMAISMFMISEGMPILHAGMEFMRSKEIPQDILDTGAVFYDVAKTADGSRSFLRNSYNACDRINNLDWARSVQKKDVVEYVKNLIKMRREHKVFCLENEEEISESLEFIDNQIAGLPEPVLAWKLDGTKCKDDWKKVLIIANPLEQNIEFSLDGEGTWKQETDGYTFNPEEKFFSAGDKAIIKTKAVSVFVQFSR